LTRILGAVALYPNSVKGFDRSGADLFALTVNSINEPDAQFIALWDVRRMPNGSHGAI